MRLQILCASHLHLPISVCVTAEFRTNISCAPALEKRIQEGVWILGRPAPMTSP